MPNTYLREVLGEQVIYIYIVKEKAVIVIINNSIDNTNTIINNWFLLIIITKRCYKALWATFPRPYFYFITSCKPWIQVALFSSITLGHFPSAVQTIRAIQLWRYVFIKQDNYAVLEKIQYIFSQQSIVLYQNKIASFQTSLNVFKKTVS